MEKTLKILVIAAAVIKTVIEIIENTKTEA